VDYEAKEDEFERPVHNNQIKLECVFHAIEDLEL